MQRGCSAGVGTQPAYCVRADQSGHRSGACKKIITVRVDGGRDLLVIFDPLVQRHLAIAVALRALEAAEELLQRLILGHLAGLHLRMVAHRVDRLDRIDRQVAQVAADLVERVEDRAHHLLARGGEPAAHAAKELVVVDRAVKVGVEGAHEHPLLGVAQAQPVNAAAVGKFLRIERARAIAVHNLRAMRGRHAQGGMASMMHDAWAGTEGRSARCCWSWCCCCSGSCCGWARTLKCRPRPRTPSAPRRLSESRSFCSTASSSMSAVDMLSAGRTGEGGVELPA